MYESLVYESLVYSNAKGDASRVIAWRQRARALGCACVALYGNHPGKQTLSTEELKHARSKALYE